MKTFVCIRAIWPILALTAAVPAQAQFLPFLENAAPAPAPRQFEPPAPVLEDEAEQGKPAASAQPKKPERSRPQPVARKFPLNPPLPPTRPWGVADAPPPVEDEPTEVAVIPATPRASAPPAAPDAPAPAPVQRAEPQSAPANPLPKPPPAAAAPAPDTGERSLVVIVRSGVKKPQDLEGRKIALGPIERDSEDLRRMFQLATGINVDPVSMGWASGLSSLARGELDGVLLGPGPKLSSTEVASLGLDGYQLLEIPLAGEAGKDPVR